MSSLTSRSLVSRLAPLARALRRLHSTESLRAGSQPPCSALLFAPPPTAWELPSLRGWQEGSGGLGAVCGIGGEEAAPSWLPPHAGGAAVIEDARWPRGGEMGVPAGEEIDGDAPPTTPDGLPAAVPLECNHSGHNTKRTFQPSIVRKKRRHGFLRRMATTAGRRVLTRRRVKGRQWLSI